jgi:hypothetical protein
VGTLARSWDLLGQSFSVLKSDKQMMWLPVLSAIFCLMAAVTIFGVGFLLLVPPGPLPQDPAAQKLLGRQMMPVLFVFYFVTYSLTIYFNVALVSIASDRLGGGLATLNDGLQIAWQRKWSILQWALLSATIGVLLQMLERRLGFLGRLIIRGTNLMWSLASFFVVPLLAAQDIGPVEAVYKSAHIFRETWGEEVAGGFSFQLITFLLSLIGLLPPLMGVHRFGQTGLFVGLAIAMIYWLVLTVVTSAARGVFAAALYRYATDKRVPPGFSREDIAGAWQPKRGY